MSSEPVNEPRLEEYTQSLREDSFVALLRSLGIAGMILLCASLISNSRASLTLPVSIVFLVTYWLSNYVRLHGDYRWAVVVFLSGALVSIIATLYFYHLKENPFIFFTPLVVVIAGILMRPRVGFVMASGASLLLAGAAMAIGDGGQVLQLPFLASVLLGYLSATVAMLSSQSFFAAVEWAIDSYHKVERREAQLFESEKQLQRALHEKEDLNNQLPAS